MNTTGSFRFRATRVGADTALSQIIRLVEDAQTSSAQIQRVADRVVVYFVPAVVSIAVIGFVVWVLIGDLATAVLAFIAVLIIACPCALGIATPAALMVGVGKGAEAGILIRGAEYLERAVKLTTVVFDKTGTLTRGQPSVTDVVALGPDRPGRWSNDEVLRFAGAAERSSEHPLGQALLRDAQVRFGTLPETTAFQAIAGHGVEATIEGRCVLVGNRRLMRERGISVDQTAESCATQLEGQGKTAMLAACDGELLGIVAVADTLKDDAAAAVAALRSEGVTVAMLTGDNERTAQTIAAQVGIDRVIAAAAMALSSLSVIANSAMLKGLKMERISAAGGRT